MVVKIMGPFESPKYSTCRIILRTQKGTIILTTTHMERYMALLWADVWVAEAEDPWKFWPPEPLRILWDHPTPVGLQGRHIDRYTYVCVYIYTHTHVHVYMYTYTNLVWGLGHVNDLTWAIWSVGEAVIRLMEGDDVYSAFRVLVESP